MTKVIVYDIAYMLVLYRKCNLYIKNEHNYRVTGNNKESKEPSAV